MGKFSFVLWITLIYFQSQSFPYYYSGIHMFSKIVIFIYHYFLRKKYFSYNHPSCVRSLRQTSLFFSFHFILQFTVSVHSRLLHIWHWGCVYIIFKAITVKSHWAHLFAVNQKQHNAKQLAHEYHWAQNTMAASWAFNHEMFLF